jgi:hypothetical protein
MQLEVAMSEGSVPQIIPIPNKSIKDITGQKFGRLLVIGYVGLRHVGKGKHGRAQWLCLCDCGQNTVRLSGHLVSGHTISCGCEHSEFVRRLGKQNQKHGMYGTPEYRAWQAMKGRCHNPKHHAFNRYGGRGIKVCDRWRESFDNFFADMGYRPGPGYSVDRIDNDGDYAPDNCRWATQFEQVNNTAKTRHITYNGVTRTTAEWAQIAGITRNILYDRVFKHGWSLERAFNQQVEPNKRSGHSTPLPLTQGCLFPE